MAKDMTRRSTLFVFLILLTLYSCGKKKPQVKTPVATTRPVPKAGIPVPLGYTETGIASWYGKPYDGRRAANGEIYDMETMVAAHKTLPFNTWVRVTLLSTGSSVDLRIIDRGPFVAGRIIDVSHAAAQRLGLIGPGVGEVKLVVIKEPADLAADTGGGFAVQIGSFQDEANADAAVRKFAGIYGSAKKVVRAGAAPSYRVLVGKAATTEDAEALAKKIRAAQNLPGAFVVRLDP